MSIPERDTIFGDTYDGVPNPMVPHRHPYPTRYHGTNFRQPEAVFSYRDRPYWLAHDPNVIRRPPSMAGSVGPDGLGAVPPLLASPTGYRVIDVGIGAVLGWLMAPSKSGRPIWAAGAAAATLLTGTLGIIGTAAVGGYVHTKKG